MTKHDMPQFLRKLMELGIVYEKDITEPFIELYWRQLKSFDWRAVDSAIEIYLATPDLGGRMPRPSDLIQCITGNRENQALQAWSLVTHAIRQVGAYSSVVFDDAIIHVIINNMGGWIMLCHTREEELPFRAREFEKHYKSYRLHPPTTYPKKLCGITEQHNCAQGYAIEPPVLIGDPMCAEKTYLTGTAFTTQIHTLSLPLLHPKKLEELSA